MWIPIIAIFTHIISFHTAIWLMAVGFGILMFFNLITLPVEFDASARAKVVLQQLNIVRPRPGGGGGEFVPERGGPDLCRGVHRFVAAVSLLRDAADESAD